jgi:hypothetical protein
MNSTIRNEDHMHFAIEADNKPCPFCGKAMSFDHAKQTPGVDGSMITFCGRVSCLRAEARRNGVSIPRRVHARSERVLRKENYHEKGINVRPDKLTRIITITGDFLV